MQLNPSPAVRCGSETYWQLLLARLCLALGQAAATPLAASVIADLFPDRSRGKALSAYYFGVYVGTSQQMESSGVKQTRDD